MYIERIEVPAFRALRDVVLDFGGEYEPQIFPLGSENGGGKSTLLQLIFVLLHCSSKPERLIYLRNLLTSDFYSGGDEQRLIARLNLRHEGVSRSLEFFALSNDFLRVKLGSSLQFGFDTEVELKLARGRLDAVESQRARHHQLTSQEIITESIAQESERLQGQIRMLTGASRSLEQDMDRIDDLLTGLGYRYITTYPCPTPTGRETRALVFRSNDVEMADSLLLEAASRTFLLGPSNQQYLFTGKTTRKALIRTANEPASPRRDDQDHGKREPQRRYVSELGAAEALMSGFYAYDWISMDPLAQLFLSARDEDFRQVVQTGQYGDRYSRLREEVNNLLFGKTVRPLLDPEGELTGIEFVVVASDGTETPLSPEDLSQGELKRLMIYAWLRAHKAEDALVLIDEIEASFHPDWQVGIVRDLQDWAPRNQYILATHSYELCQALTPRHIRSLEPALRRGPADAEKDGAQGG